MTNKKKEWTKKEIREHNKKAVEMLQENKKKEREKNEFDEPKKFLVMGGSSCSGAAGTENVAIFKAKSKYKAEKKARESDIYGMRGNRPSAYQIEELDDGWSFIY